MAVFIVFVAIGVTGLGLYLLETGAGKLKERDYRTGKLERRRAPR